MTALTVAEVLREAAQVIAERGLCKGDFSSSGISARGAVCAWGAINVVVMGTPWRDDDDRPLAKQDEIIRAALTTLADSLRLSVGSPIRVYAAVAAWSDAQSSAAAVRDALLAAAEYVGGAS